MSGTLWAQSTPTASEVDKQARAYFKVEAYDAAAAEFLRAFEIDGEVNRLFNAALAYEKAGLKEKAIATYSRFAELAGSGDKVVEANARKVALERALADEVAVREKTAALHARLDAAQKLLAAKQYSEAAAAYDAAHEMSGDAEQLFDAADARRLGAFEDEALQGYRRYLREAPNGVRRREAQKRVDELEAALAGAQNSDSPEAPIALERSDRPPASSGQGMGSRRMWGLGLGAVGGLSLITGTIFGLQARADRDDALDPSIGACDPDFTVCNARGAQLFDDAKSSANTASVFLGLGLVAGAAGAYLWFASGDPSSEGEGTGLSLRPAIADDSAGLVLGGRF